MSKNEVHSRKYFLKAIAALLSTALFVWAYSSKAQSNWETLVDYSSFNSQASFTNYWNYNYPWGTDHNGTARMNATNVIFASGMVTLTSRPTNDFEGYSPSTPHLEIRYNAGTICLKQTITICPQYPVWDISGQFMVPTNLGTWPAFWMTGAHSWPPESDFMEFKGQARCNQNTYDGSWQVKITPLPDASTTWHSYRVLATLENSTNVNFRYYIDGIMEASHHASTFVNSPCWLIIDFQMEGDSGSPGPAETTYFRMKNIVVKRQKSSGTPANAVGN
jgi:hypothetical protein